MEFVSLEYLEHVFMIITYYRMSICDKDLHIHVQHTCTSAIEQTACNIVHYSTSITYHVMLLSIMMTIVMYPVLL